MNPLLTDSPLPHFTAVEPAHVEPAIRQLLDENRHTLPLLARAPGEGWSPTSGQHHRLAHGRPSAT
jgi:oligopeptidase A